MVNYILLMGHQTPPPANVLSHLHIRKGEKCGKQMMNQIKRMIYNDIWRALGVPVL